MAINKRKILQSAQKHLQKGALEKALKDYQILLKADPRDANVRLKIGDIELKRGRRDEAVAAYLKVAESFMRDGFDAKAVALYKQITKIDDKRADVLVPLADLYQRMGLQSDAMVTLQTAADVHYQNGCKDDALDLLRRMAALDPSNTNSRLKVADLLRQEDRNEEAISEFEEVAAELDRQGAEEDRIRVLVRVLELAPDRIDLLASVARSRLDSSKFEAAEKTANLMIEQQPDEPDAWLLLGEARGKLGHDSESIDAYRRAAEIHRERGNDDVARDITQRFVAPATVSDSGAEDVADDQLLGSTVEDLGAEAGEPTFDPNGMSLGSPLGESNQRHTEVEDASLPPLPQVDASETQVVPEVDGDPEQLLAEASVYLRYGKHDRAIASLRAIVRQDPASVAAFAKLGEALEASGQIEHAVTSYERGAQAAGQAGDAEAFDRLRQCVAVLDAERAEALVPPESDLELQSEPDPESEPIAQIEDDAFGSDAEDDALASDVEDDVLASDVEDDALASDAEDDSVALEIEDDVLGSDLDDDALGSDTGDDSIALEIEDDVLGSDAEDDSLGSDAEDDSLASVAEADADTLGTSTDVEIEFDVDVELDDSEQLDESEDVLELAGDEIAIDLAPQADSDAEVEEEELVPEFDLSGEVELAIDPPASEPEPLAAEPVTAESVMPEVADDVDCGLEAVEESPMEVSTDSEDAVGIEISDPVLDSPLDDDEEAVGLGDAVFEESQGEVSLERSDEVAGASSSATTPAQMAEDLEEADFFYQQGMLDEARIVYERILSLAPSHPGALLRVGEIEAASAGHVAGVGIEMSAGLAEEDTPEPVDLVGDDIFDDEDDSTEDPAPVPAAEFGGDPDEDTGPILNVVEPETADEDSAAETVQVAPSEEAEPEVLEPETPESETAEPETPESEAIGIADAAFLEEDASARVTEAEVTAPVVFEAASDDAAGFDLAAQLSDAFDLDDEAGAGMPLAAGTEGEGFEEVFAAFKQGVEGALEDGDFEARYDLGIAYKEMGLHEDAIGEFQAAMGAEARKLPCLHMMGLCAFELGRIIDAVAHLEQALGLPGVQEEQQIGLRFDLGRAYAGVGDVPRAREAFEAVKNLDPEFPAFAIRKNKESRKIVADMCEELGLRYIKSNTNFTFIETGMQNSVVQEKMREFGIMTGRDFPPYHDSWTRISMARPEEMRYFVQAYKQLFA